MTAQIKIALLITQEIPEPIQRIQYYLRQKPLTQKVAKLDVSSVRVVNIFFTSQKSIHNGTKEENVVFYATQEFW